MIVRMLRLVDEPATEIPIRLASPVMSAAGGDWWCRVEIGWPGRVVVREVGGVDAAQALQLALQLIGTELYTSELHQSGRLMWLTPGAGYGFPVPRNIRDLLIGDDREMV